VSEVETSSIDAAQPTDVVAEQEVNDSSEQVNCIQDNNVNTTANDRTTYTTDPTQTETCPSLITTADSNQEDNDRLLDSLEQKDEAPAEPSHVNTNDDDVGDTEQQQQHDQHNLHSPQQPTSPPTSSDYDNHDDEFAEWVWAYNMI